MSAAAPPRHVVAVDAGGSGCRALVADLSGRVLGRGTGGPANATSDPAGAIASATAAIRAAAAAAGLAAGELAAASGHVGMAGIQGDAAALAVATALPLARCRMSEDVDTALAGALGVRDGALLAIGTGSIVAARRGGAVRRVGGWGLAVSDQASGAWLGRALLARTLHCHDGLVPHSALTRETLAGFADGAAGIAAHAAAAGPAGFAARAPAIVRAAGEGDRAAVGLLRAGARYLGRALAALDLGGDDVVCLSGGLGPSYAPYLGRAVQARLADPAGSPLDGALALALAALRAEARP